MRKYRLNRTDSNIVESVCLLKEAGNAMFRWSSNSLYNKQRSKGFGSKARQRGATSEIRMGISPKHRKLSLIERKASKPSLHCSMIRLSFDPQICLDDAYVESAYGRTPERRRTCSQPLHETSRRYSCQQKHRELLCASSSLR